jgi:hypothetical protein
MDLRIIGEYPFARHPDGSLKTRIATLFVSSRTLVTLPGIHATQKTAYVEDINRRREQQHEPPLTAPQEMVEWAQSVDLIVEDDETILIRPDPLNMKLALSADEVLQTAFSKRCIKFLYVSEPRVREAIRRRGEYWRIAALPRSPNEMIAMIEDARMSLGGPCVYYYNLVTGTKYLTLQEFSALGLLDEAQLRQQMQEIASLCTQRNRFGQPEVDFFLSGSRGMHEDVLAVDWSAVPDTEVRSGYEAVRARFEAVVDPELRRDSLDNLHWRKAMFLALLGPGAETDTEEILQGLSPEFFMRIEWLPGGRIEDGELILDPVFDEQEKDPGDAEMQRLCDPNARGFIFNLIREFGDVEFVNIGRIVHNGGTRPPSAGRHDLYLAEIKQQDVATPFVRILRMLKWGIREHLEEGKDLLRSIIESEEYTEYILDRRLGCRHLGMNLPTRIVTRRIGERYVGSRHDFQGQVIWATYIERDYVPGMATSKIPATRFANEAFAMRFARLLGWAAGGNIVVGRVGLDGRVLFDDGDEVLVEDAGHEPVDIVVTDPNGTFADYERPLAAFAPEYAEPVLRRLPLLSCSEAFAQAYIKACIDHFRAIQAEYRKRRRAFDRLFKHRRYEHGSFAWRWTQVLRRLDETDPDALEAALRACLAPAAATPPTES